MKKVQLLGPALTVTVTILLTSGCWLAAYFIGVKPNINRNNEQNTTVNCPANPTSKPEHLCNIPPMPKCDSCELYLCETIPDNLNLDKLHNSTTQCWLNLMKSAQNEIKIGSYYWTLLLNDSTEITTKFNDPNNSTGDGAEIYETILETAKRGVKFQIAQNGGESDVDEATELAAKSPNINVRTMDFKRLLGGGIIHTKTWHVDGKHFYVGSANFDWRSLRQVKELGVLAMNCPCLADDIEKIIDTYWDLGTPTAEIPKYWPDSRSVPANFDRQYSVPQPDGTANVFMSSAPPEFNGCGRESDIDAMVKIIDDANEYVHLAVMDYMPATEYQAANYFYPKLDDAIRRAAFRRVKVKFMISKWGNSKPEQFAYMHSLVALNGSLPCEWAPGQKYKECAAGKAGEIEVRVFQLPADGDISDKIYARVQHNKYFVTEKTAYIDTAGIGFALQSDNIGRTSVFVKQVQTIYMRDWNSQYATDISEFDSHGNRLHTTDAYDEL